MILRQTMHTLQLYTVHADLPQLADRCEQLTKRFLVKTADSANCLNYP